MGNDGTEIADRAGMSLGSLSLPRHRPRLTHIEELRRDGPAQRFDELLGVPQLPTVRGLRVLVVLCRAPPIERHRTNTGVHRVDDLDTQQAVQCRPWVSVDFAEINQRTADFFGSEEDVAVRYGQSRTGVRLRRVLQRSEPCTLRA